MYMSFYVVGLLTGVGVLPRERALPLVSERHPPMALGTEFQAASSRDFPSGSDGKESAWQCRRCVFDPWVRKIP